MLRFLLLESSLIQTFFPSTTFFGSHCHSGFHLCQVNFYIPDCCYMARSSFSHNFFARTPGIPLRFWFREFGIFQKLFSQTAFWVRRFSNGKFICPIFFSRRQLFWVSGFHFCKVNFYIVFYALCYVTPESSFRPQLLFGTAGNS